MSLKLLHAAKNLTSLAGSYNTMKETRNVEDEGREGTLLSGVPASLLALHGISNGSIFNHHLLWSTHVTTPMEKVKTEEESPPEKERSFVCLTCNQSFKHKHVLKNHERTHTGERPFECKECHRRFRRDHHLRTHIRTHTGEKPYHCDHCDRYFVQVANLRRHLRVHTGERPYACQMCSARFADSNQLKAHSLIHKGEKPFGCKLCGANFRRRHHLTHHKCDSKFGVQVVPAYLSLPVQTEPEDLSIRHKNENIINNNNFTTTESEEELSEEWDSSPL